MKELLKNKRLVGSYILWVTIQFVLFIFSLANPDHNYGSGNAQGHFWPFTEKSFARSYDYSELLIFSIVPIGLIVSFRLIFPGNSGKQ